MTKILTLEKVLALKVKDFWSYVLYLMIYLNICRVGDVKNRKPFEQKIQQRKRVLHFFSFLQKSSNPPMKSETLKSRKQ